jgi:hypothetical protein
MSVRTGMYHFEVSRTALYPLRPGYVPARTSTYHLVLPCTRGTGFQMDGPQRSSIQTTIAFSQAESISNVNISFCT